MTCILTEKPSVARDIAKIFGAKDYKDGYIDGGNFVFTWAFGHLIELAKPDAYGYRGWNLSNLPMQVNQFILQVRTKKIRNVYKTDPDVKKQLDVIHGLFQRCDYIYVATDSGREGELIFRYIYSFLECKKPFMRLWISSLTDEAIKAGFKSIRPGSDFDNLYKAAKCRSEADWLVGLNATMALTLKADNKQVMSLGRVQTPTLALICQRYTENKNFKSEAYYRLKLTSEKDDVSFDCLSENVFEKEPKELLTHLEPIEFSVVSNVEVKQKNEHPPLLYDLTTLQREANKKFAYTAQQTLNIAQKLYEAKLITYPRTNSQYISDDIFVTIPELIQNIEKYPDNALSSVAKSLAGKRLNQRSVNNNKITDHHALLPTGQNAGFKEDSEKAIYEMILKRLLESFSDVCKKETTNVELLLKDQVFKSSSTKIIIPGWRVFGNHDDDDDCQIIPELIPDEKLKKKSLVIEKYKTKPEPIHNEDTLLYAMETCGKHIEDPDLREAMKESGLGTPATRATILETLIARNYVVRKKRQLIPTETGLQVYELVRDKKISSPELTGEWELFFNRIEQGKENPNVFMNKIKSFVSEVIGEIQNKELDVQAPKNMILCPACKKGHILKSENNWYCSDYRNCSFRIWPVAKVFLTAAQARQLCETGKTDVIKGFQGKSGAFDTCLALDDTFNVVFYKPKKENNPDHDSRNT